jgi:hypothetical protein
MYKLLTFAGCDHAGPHIFPIEPDRERTVGHIKMARPLPPRVEHYIKTAKPIAGKTQLLIDALGAGEYWGPNSNSDYFPEEALRHEGDDYGFRTFEKYAHPFKHHANGSPTRAYGDRVRLAEYDPVMHRVLLVCSVHDDKCQDILGDLAKGRYWDVSMGCFTGETLITMGDGTRKRIDQIVDGEWVLTHRGRPRRVTRVHRRHYEGDLFCIRAEAHETIRCTHQHPFLAVERNQVLRTPHSKSKRWFESPVITPSWVHAECLTDHMVMEPVLQEVLTPDFAERAFARLLGYYLAEGHVIRNKERRIVGIELNTHRDDPVHAEILDLCRQFGTKNDPWTYPKPNSEFSRGICIFDERLANLCFEHAGGYAKKKRLSDSAMRWDPAIQRELLGAFANGDGCGLKSGALILSTASDYLAWQFMTLLPRLGITASIQNLEHKAGSGFSVRNTYEWVVFVGKQYAQGLRSVCAKVIASEVRATKYARRIVPDHRSKIEYVLTPIRETHRLYVETEVFNLEVDEDESYIAAGLAVHNCRVPFDVCSICKNRARTRAEYCPHLRYQMRKILPDGRQVCAINTLPKFFDISFVLIGAEKAAHVLKKVAHSVGGYELRSSAEEGERHYGKLAQQVKASATKEADIDKKVPSNLPPSAEHIRPIDPGKKKHLVELADRAGAVKASETPLPDGLLDLLAGFPLNELGSTLTALGLPLKPEEFQRIILVKTGQRPLADKLFRKGVVFDEHKLASSTPAWARPLERFELGAVNEKIALLLRPHLKGRCCYPEPLLRRLERLDKQAEKDERDPLIYNRQWYPATDDERSRASGVSGFVPAGLALAAAFLLLKRQFPQMVENGPLALLARHPWLLPILVAGGVGATVGWQSLLRPMPLQNDSRRVDAMGAPVEAPSSKTASDGAPWMRLGVVPMTYLYAGIQRQRAEHGEPLGTIDHFIASRPDLAALSSFALAPTVERGVKKLLHKSASALDHELAASPWDAAIVHHIARLTQPKETGHAHVG